MYIGQIIMSGQTSWSPWFERRSDGIKVQVELMGIGGTDSGGNVTVALWTKKKEDVGDGDAVTGSASVTVSSAGSIGSITISPAATGTAGMEEMVRFKMDSTAAEPGEMRWAYFRILTPTWYDQA